MKDRNNIYRRDILKKVGGTATGMSMMGTAGTAAADPKDGNGGHAGKGGEIDAETYVETGDYIYRRVRTAESDFLVRIEIESGEVTFAEVASKSDGKYIQTDNIGSLKSQTKAAVSGSVDSESLSTAENIPHPSQIVADTNGVSAQDEVVIFERIDVEEEYLGGCGNVLYIPTDGTFDTASVEPVTTESIRAYVRRYINNGAKRHIPTAHTYKFT
ncbi:MAG: hypothetical protein V5A34_07560 [Halapricum sp.]